MELSYKIDRNRKKIDHVFLQFSADTPLCISFKEILFFSTYTYTSACRNGESASSILSLQVKDHFDIAENPNNPNVLLFSFSKLEACDLYAIKNGQVLKINNSTLESHPIEIIPDVYTLVIKQRNKKNSILQIRFSLNQIEAETSYFEDIDKKKITLETDHTHKHQSTSLSAFTEENSSPASASHANTQHGQEAVIEELSAEDQQDWSTLIQTLAAIQESVGSLEQRSIHLANEQDALQEKVDKMVLALQN